MASLSITIPDSTIHSVDPSAETPVGAVMAASASAGSIALVATAAIADTTRPRDPTTGVEIPSCSSWAPRTTLPVREAFLKSEKNLMKAAEEHISAAGEADKAVYITGDEAVIRFAVPKKEGDLSFSYTDYSAQGPVRRTMEDAHFISEFSEGIIAGVCDGHGGAEAKLLAQYVATTFQSAFPAMLAKHHGNTFVAFEELSELINKNILGWTPWGQIGCTAVITFIDKKSQVAYTATIGDSEANTYVEVDGTTKSMAMSAVRSWTSEKDTRRHAIASGDARIVTLFPTLAEPKVHARFPFYYESLTDDRYLCGSNVSRAFGDAHRRGTPDKPAIIVKPKITVSPVRPGDVVVLACDGLKDFAAESEVAATVGKAKREGRDIATALGELVLPTGAAAKSQDNVTIIAIQVA